MNVNAMHLGAESFNRLVDRTLQPLAAGAPPPAVPKPIVEWMARLMLLENVPFEYLVPHPLMLPTESIRLFVIDTNWLLRAMEGAASAGVASSRDVVSMLTVIEQAAQQVFTAAISIRNQDRGAPVNQNAAVAPTGWSGFLMRSVAVQNWPGLEVTAVDQTGAALSPLRIDRLSPDVMLCIFNGVAAKVSVMEPPETLHFGVFENGNQPYVILRGLNAGGQNAGMTLPGSPSMNVQLRNNASYPGTVMVAATATQLSTTLKADGFLPPSGITSAEYAIEMVHSAGLQTFQRSGAL
jgi:hypothetical protein